MWVPVARRARPHDSIRAAGGPFRYAAPMPGRLNLVMKTATEYRVGSLDGDIERAEETMILTLVSLVGGHAMCERDGGHIVIPGSAPVARRLPPRR